MLSRRLSQRLSVVRCVRAELNENRLAQQLVIGLLFAGTVKHILAVRGYT